MAYPPLEGGPETVMKATIERATLLRCLSHVQSVVERRNTIPILSNVLIEASGGGALRVMATDLDLQVVETMGAVSVEAAGAITVSAHLLFDIARKLPDGALVLAGNGGTVLVSRDNGESFVPLATGSTKAFARAILGPPGAVILIGETGAREAQLPLAKR